MISRQIFSLVAILAPVFLPTALFARTNSVTTGLSTSYDYNDRQTDETTADTNGGASTEESTADDEDYSKLTLRPLVIFTSESEQDRFEFRAAPSIKYDLNNEDSDWDNDLYLSAQRAVSKKWILNASNAYLRSDYHDTQSEDLAITESADTADTTPTLSSDLGRTRYWRNALKAGSKYIYDEQSSIDLGGDFTMLRYDEAGLDNREDYDRLALHLKNEHRYNTFWKSGSELTFVRGTYDPEGTATDGTGVELSNDLKEYHLQGKVDNTSFHQETLSLKYSYIGVRYDETSLEDGDIHQPTLSWRHEFSQHLNTTLGAGPSYEKTEGRDANWGSNGQAEINYFLQHGALTLGVEKRYDVDNFSGSDSRGFVDYWNTYFQASYKILSPFSIKGKVAYRDEDRQDSGSLSEDVVAANTSSADSYHQDQFTTGIGLTYEFLQYYSAQLNYTFTQQNSDRADNDYDDHRVLFTLSWKQEWMRW